MMKKGWILLTAFLFTTSSHTVSDLFSAKAPSFSEILKPYNTISPFMSRLLQLKEQDLQKELEKLWLLGKQGRLPMIENDPLEKGYRFITLVYRDDSGKKVGFDVFGIYDETCFGDMQLRRLKKTDFHYRCFKVPKDICFSYRFKVTDPKTGKTAVLTDPFNPNRIPSSLSRNLSYSVLDLNEGERNWNLPPQKPTGSRTETIHYTDGIVGRKRTVSIYLPDGYQPDRNPSYPTLYLFDAPIYLNRVEVPNILDNLIEERKIEPIIAVLFGTYRSTRDVILPLNFKFKEEFISRFLPLIRSRFNTSTRPEENIIGRSRGTVHNNLTIC